MGSRKHRAWLHLVAFTGAVGGTLEAAKTTRVAIPQEMNMSEADKRVRDFAKVAALIRFAPDLFDKQMAELANNPEAMRELAAVMPARLTPEQREKADKMLAELEGAAYPPGGIPSEDRGAWTCSLCGFRGFWHGGTHDCKAAAADGQQAKRPAPK